MSKLIQSRAEFQQLAEVRLAEAKALLDAQPWDGAYYLAGYAVELALKACIVKRLMNRDAFPDKKFSDSCYTHDLNKLIRVAELDVPLEAAMIANGKLSGYVGLAEAWSELTRYHRVDRAEAEDLYRAVSNSPDGVLAWIKSHW